jgi:PIN domain nuclease of toxin-antitoxin system
VVFGVTFLLDTHVLLWWLSDDPRLSAEHREIIAESSNEVLVSSISVAEISLKSSIGKLGVPGDVGDVIRNSGFGELEFATRHALRLRELPWHHRDPFDRMLISQASVDNLIFLSSDPRCREYDVRTALENE